MPPRLWLERSNVSWFLEVDAIDSYRTLLAEAEAVAAAEFERLFSEDAQLRAATVTISARRNGQMAPILSFALDRDRWRRNPNPSRWDRHATFYTASLGLLGFVDSPDRPARPRVPVESEEEFLERLEEDPAFRDD